MQGSLAVRIHIQKQVVIFQDMLHFHKCYWTDKTH